MTQVFRSLTQVFRSLNRGIALITLFLCAFIPLIPATSLAETGGAGIGEDVGGKLLAFTVSGMIAWGLLLGLVVLGFRRQKKLSEEIRELSRALDAYDKQTQGKD